MIIILLLTLILQEHIIENTDILYLQVKDEMGRRNCKKNFCLLTYIIIVLFCINFNNTHTHTHTHISVNSDFTENITVTCVIYTRRCI